MNSRIAPLRWVSQDGKLIILARGLRNFAQGSIAVFLVIYLDKLGFNLLQIGVYLSAGVAGSGFLTFLMGFVADRLGRRKLLVATTLLTASAGLSLVFLDDFVLLTLLAFWGTLATTGGPASAGASQPLEQASLPDTAPTHKRTDLFAIYRIVGAAGAALGALTAGLPIVFQKHLGLGELGSFRVMFGGFVALLIVVTLLYSRLSSEVEVAGAHRRWTNPLQLPSRRRIFTLVGLFGVDQFGGSLLVQGLVAYWFNTRFGIELGSLAFIFFLSQGLTATSLWVAAKLANRIGLINTMVFTHIPSSLFLLAAAFAPTAWMAVLFWQLRAFFGQMDVPTRDSYTMAVVSPQERVVMASMTGVGRGISGTLGPSIATTLWHTFAASAPFVGCAVLKIGYDLTLFYMFRHVRPPEENSRMGARGEAASVEATETRFL